MIPISQLQKLITEGKTDVLDGFCSSRTGKSFEAALKLENGKAVFDFPAKNVQTQENAQPLAPIYGEAVPLPDEPPPGY